VNNFSSLISTNNSEIFRKCQEGLVSLGKCFLSPTAITNIGRADFVDHLFGDLTHFSYVVELGDKTSRERKRL